MPCEMRPLRPSLRVSACGWTPFSPFAVQCACYLSIHIRRTDKLSALQAPNHPAGMQALLKRSVQTYGLLPSELHPRRIRSHTSSRLLLYPPNRFVKITISPEKMTTPKTGVKVPTATLSCVKFPSIPIHYLSRLLSMLSSISRPLSLISNPSMRTRSDLRPMSDLM